MMSCAEDAEALPLVERIKLSRSIWQGSDSASAPPAVPSSRPSSVGSLLIGITFSGMGVVLGAEVFCSCGESGPPEPAVAELGREDAGVEGAAAGEGLAPLPLPGAAIFGRLKGLKG